MTETVGWAGAPALECDVLAYSACCLLVDDIKSREGSLDFVTSTLEKWELLDQLPRVRATVDELVGNALTHGQQEICAGPAPSVGMVSLIRDGRDLACAVFDPGTATPRLSARGVGLRIVEAAGDVWGWTAPGLYGKAVWCYFSGSGAAAAVPEPIVEQLLMMVEIFTGSGDPRTVTAHPV
ncbi:MULTISPECIES: ATP-binding protein [unclassified Streptomyces]|uniref:ATP-binding protein n=1 Tax=unclassified Streptomyces TaxID=2593676 RepID=UPI00340FE0D7